MHSFAGDAPSSLIYWLGAATELRFFFPRGSDENGMKLTPKRSRCDNKIHFVGMRLGGRGGGQ